MAWWMWFIAGVIAGMAVFRIISGNQIRKNSVGALLEKQSEPDELPYLFLELKADGMDMIRKSRYVTFKVELGSRD